MKDLYAEVRERLDAKIREYAEQGLGMKERARLAADDIQLEFENELIAAYNQGPDSSLTCLYAIARLTYFNSAVR